MYNKMIVAAILIFAVFGLFGLESAAAISVNAEGSYEFSYLEEDSFITFASIEFSKYSTDYEFELPADVSGDVTIQIKKVGGGLGFIDYAAIDGKTPVTDDAYLLKKLSDSDLDIIEIKEDGLILSFKDVTDGKINVCALIEPEVVLGFPFKLDLLNLESGKKPLATYDFENQNKIIIDGKFDLDLLNENNVFKVYYTQPHTGHPDGNAWIWVFSDEENLYVATEWGSDNTYDYGDDYFTVVIDDGSDLVKEYTQYSDRGNYGRSAMIYTDKLAYEHMYYEMAIPREELSSTNEINIGFILYGTAAMSLKFNDSFMPPSTAEPGKKLDTFKINFTGNTGYTIKLFISDDNTYHGTDYELKESEKITEDSKTITFSNVEIPDIPKGSYFLIAAIGKYNEEEWQFSEVSINNPIQITDAKSTDKSGSGFGQARVIELGNNATPVQEKKDEIKEPETIPENENENKETEKPVMPEPTTAENNGLSSVQKIILGIIIIGGIAGIGYLFMLRQKKIQ